MTIHNVAVSEMVVGQLYFSAVCDVIPPETQRSGGVSRLRKMNDAIVIQKS